MIGAAVILVLCGLMFPIAMLLAALFFDALVVTWALFQVWHDHWSARFTRHAPRPAH